MVAGPLTIVQMLPELISGGVERGTLEIGSYLVENGHRSIVVSNGGPMAESLVKKGSIHIKLPVGEKNPRVLACIPELRRIFIQEKVDILHLRSRLPAWAGLLAIKTLPKKYRPKILTTFHGFYSVNAYSAVMTKSEKIIAVSRLIHDHILENYPVQPERITTINRGCDISIFDPEKVDKTRISNLRQQWGINHEKGPVLMLPGRFTRLKGHEFFFCALEKIKHLDWTAVLVGDENENPGYARELRQSAQEKGLSERVVFAGHCSDMAAAFMLSDVTVSASLHPESFGRVAVESQAMGVPVAATAHGGSLEIIRPGKTGWLFPPNQVDAFARVLQEAVTDPDKRQAIGKQGQKMVHEKFTVKTMCEKTLSLYKDLVLKKSSKQ